MTQLVELHGLLKARGKETRIVAISPDPMDKVERIIDKVTGRANAPFAITLLSDAKHAVMDRYGLRNEAAAANGRYLPHPTTYVLDSDGVVRWKFTERDYKVRPTNEMILRELEKVR